MMQAPVAARRLVSPGPIADMFMRSRAFICGIIGPVGSGKTMAALQKGLRVAAMQGGIVDANGVTWRKARIGVIRESYPSLQSTTLKSWFNIVPEREGKFGWKAPFTHSFRKILRREGNTKGGRPLDVLDVEFEFRAIGDGTVEEACRGWEVNAVIIDEADLQPADLVPFLTGRVGRFSNLSPELVVDPQIILSLNMPDIENHIYRLLVDKEIEGLSEQDQGDLATVLNGRLLIECFIQPGGREPGAENLHNLPGKRGYYILQVAANKHKPGYVDRMVDNKPVPLQHGQAVNAKFTHTHHVRAQEWDCRRLVVLGIDQGYNAAAVATQRTMLGDLRALAEVVNVAEGGKALIKIGARDFARRCKQMLADRFPGIQKTQVRVVADPAAFRADDAPDVDRDWLLAFEAELGFKVHRAKSNRQALRNEAVWQAQDRIGGYEVDPSCKHLIKAHLGGYRYAKAEMTTGESKGHLPIANTIYTHVADAEQYAALEGENVILEIRGQKARDGGSAVVADSDYNILGDW